MDQSADRARRRWHGPSAGGKRQPVVVQWSAAARRRLEPLQDGVRLSGSRPRLRLRRGHPAAPRWGDRPTGRTPGDVGTAGRLRGVSERRHAPCAHAAARGLTGRPPRIAGRAMVRGSAAWRCSAVGEFRQRRARLGPSTGRARMDASLPPGDGAVGGGRGVSLVGPTPVDGDRSPKLGVLRRRRFGHVVPPAPEPPSWNCAHGSHQVGDRRPQAGLGTVGVRPAGSSARTWRHTSRPAA
jgi:hypothetical protein